MEKTEHAPGTPSWVDLGSPDTDASASFYGSLFGWTAEDPAPGEDTGGYRMFMYKGKAVAGLGPQQSPGPPYWTTYVTVKDADAAVKTAKKAGANVFMEPMDVMDAGRMAVLADPTGAAFSVWQPKAHIGSELVNEPNTLCWNELSTRDTAKAIEFYRTLFGWKATTHGEGQGAYTEFDAGSGSIAGMMPMPPGVPDQVPAYWLVYFSVEDADAAVAKATGLGATVTVPLMDVEPGRFAVLSDPQGAMFAVIKLSEQRTGG